MKISIDDQVLFTLTDIQKKVIQNEIPCEIFEEDMKRRIKWVLIDEKYNRCLERLKNEWCGLDECGESKLSKLGVKHIPTNSEELASLILSQPTYKNRSQREAESKKN